MAFRGSSPATSAWQQQQQQRVILHVDLDCFYAAVEHVRLGISREVPLAVQQWEGLIAVNYAARKRGITRHERVAEAKRKCPDLALVHVETIGCSAGGSRNSGKVSLERYRQASLRVFKIFRDVCSLCERASVDEAYFDVSQQVQSLLAEKDDSFWRELAASFETKAVKKELTGDKEEADAGAALRSHCELAPSHVAAEAPEGTLQCTAVIADDCPGQSARPAAEGAAEAAAAGAGGTAAAADDVARSSFSDSDPQWRRVVLDGPLDPAAEEGRRLLAGTEVARKLQEAVFSALGYTVSVGVASNKLLAKMGSAMTKPMGMTVVTPRAVPALMSDLPLKKVRLLGGKLGKELESLGLSTAGEAQSLSLPFLTDRFGERLGNYVWKAVRGLDDSPVQVKSIPKSMLAAKSFSPTSSMEGIRRWVSILSQELADRMLSDAIRNCRRPNSFHVHCKGGQRGGGGVGGGADAWVREHEQSKSAVMASAVGRIVHAAWQEAKRGGVSVTVGEEDEEEMEGEEEEEAEEKHGGGDIEDLDKPRALGSRAEERRRDADGGGGGRGTRLRSKVSEVGPSTEATPPTQRQETNLTAGWLDASGFFKADEEDAALVGEKPDDGRTEDKPDSGRTGETTAGSNVSVRSNSDSSSSPLAAATKELQSVLANESLRLLLSMSDWLPCSRLAISATAFVPLEAKGNHSINEMFAAASSRTAEMAASSEEAGASSLLLAARSTTEKKGASSLGKRKIESFFSRPKNVTVDSNRQSSRNEASDAAADDAARSGKTTAHAFVDVRNPRDRKAHADDQQTVDRNDFVHQTCSTVLRVDRNKDTQVDSWQQNNVAPHASFAEHVASKVYDGSLQEHRQSVDIDVDAGIDIDIHSIDVEEQQRILSGLKMNGRHANAPSTKAGAKNKHVLKSRDSRPSSTKVKVDISKYFKTSN